MTPNVPGENKSKVLKTLRSEIFAIREDLYCLEKRKVVPEDNKDPIIVLLREEVVIVRKMIDLLKKEKDAKKNI